MSFRSENKSSKHDLNQLNRAIRIRINGHLEKTDEKSIFRRSGAEQINQHAIKELLEVAREIPGIAVYPLYTGTYRKRKLWVLRNKGCAIIFIYRNWINPLHNNLLSDINDSLEEAESILKKKQNVKKVWKILFTPEIEEKGQKTLNFELKNGIKHYSLPYISPKTLDEYVKKHTNVNIRDYYPAQEHWNKGIKSLLRSYLMKLLDKVKKKVKTTSNYAQKWLKRRIIHPIHTPSGYNNNNNNKGLNLELLPYKPLQDPIFEDPPPQVSSLLEPKRSINIEIPEDKLKVRIAVFKKLSKRGIVRTYTKTIFYKAHWVEEKKKGDLRSYIFKKHFITKLRPYQLMHGMKTALNNCIYALLNYRPRDKLKERERLRYLKIYKKEMLRAISTN